MAKGWRISPPLISLPRTCVPLYKPTKMKQTKKQLSVLGIDVGKHTGWAFVDDSANDSGTFEITVFSDFEREIKALLELYTPSAVVVGQPNLFGRRNGYHTLAKHFGYIGILSLLCEKRALYLFILNDSSARKEVFGNGKITKDEVRQKMEVPSEDEADALVLALAQLNFLKKAQNEQT